MNRRGTLAIVLPILVLLALGLAVAACGDGGNTTTTQAPTTTTQAPTTTSAAGSLSPEELAWATQFAKDALDGGNLVNEIGEYGSDLSEGDSTAIDKIITLSDELDAMADRVIAVEAPLRFSEADAVWIEGWQRIKTYATLLKQGVATMDVDIINQANTELQAWGESVLKAQDMVRTLAGNQ